jgi:hypothetical protein
MRPYRPPPSAVALMNELAQKFPKVGQLIHARRREEGYVDPIAEMEEIVFRLRDSAEIDGGLPLGQLLLFLDSRFQIGDEAVDYLIAGGFLETFGLLGKSKYWALRARLPQRMGAWMNAVSPRGIEEEASSEAESPEAGAIDDQEDPADPGEPDISLTDESVSESDSQVLLLNELGRRFPKAGEIILAYRRREGRVGTYGELGEVMFWMRDSAETNTAPEIREILLFLESKFQVGHEEVDELIAISFLEGLALSGARYHALRAQLPDRMAAWLDDRYPPRLDWGDT